MARRGYLVEQELSASDALDDCARTLDSVM
jgi:hypothetical protein